MKEAKVLSIFSQKGGVSKTTTSINIATCLALKGFKTLLIDNDPQGNASESFDMYLNDKNIYHVMVKNLPIADAICKSLITNLDILPADITHAQTEVFLMSAMSREMVLAKAIKKVRNQYDYIIIDCPPSLGLLSINSLAASTDVVIPVRVGKYALRGLQNLFTTVEQVKECLNENLKVAGIVITQNDAQTNISREISQSLREQLSDLLFETTISKATKVVESEFENKPIVIFDKSSRPAREYAMLTEEVVKRVG